RRILQVQYLPEPSPKGASLCHVDNLIDEAKTRRARPRSRQHYPTSARGRPVDRLELHHVDFITQSLRKSVRQLPNRNTATRRPAFCRHAATVRRATLVA